MGVANPEPAIEPSDVRAMRVKLAEANRLIHEVFEAATVQSNLLTAGEGVNLEKLYWGIGHDTHMYLDEARRKLRLAEIALYRQRDPRDPDPLPVPKRIVVRRKASS